MKKTLWLSPHKRERSYVHSWKMTAFFARLFKKFEKMPNFFVNFALAYAYEAEAEPNHTYFMPIWKAGAASAPWPPRRRLLQAKGRCDRPALQQLSGGAPARRASGFSPAKTAALPIPPLCIPGYRKRGAIGAAARHAAYSLWHMTGRDIRS